MGFAFIGQLRHTATQVHDPQLPLMKKVMISGTAQPGFESVKALFEDNLKHYFEDNAQLCVYVNDECVVDLWGSASGDAHFDGDSLINIFSSGKSLESIAMAWLISEGLLDYDTRVTEYWPEFGGSGKAHLTVADIMRHEGGLAAFNQTLNPLDLHREGLHQNKIGQIIESHPLYYRSENDGDRREYHALTRGWIVNEIFRRVDPQQRTIGTFLEQNIQAPLSADIMVGVPSDALSRIAVLKPVGFKQHLQMSAHPFKSRRQTHHNVLQLSARLAGFVLRNRRTMNLKRPVPFEGMQRIEAFNEPVIAMGETPSANAHCSARGLAKLGSAMAMGGTTAGHQVINPQAWQSMHDQPVQREMGMNTTFTQGGVAHFSHEPPPRTAIDRGLNTGREGFYGWMGLGGSIFQWHPGLKIGFAFVPTSLHVLDFVNERGKTLQAEVLQCLRN